MRRGEESDPGYPGDTAQGVGDGQDPFHPRVMLTFPSAGFSVVAG